MQFSFPRWFIIAFLFNHIQLSCTRLWENASIFEEVLQDQIKTLTPTSTEVPSAIGSDMQKRINSFLEPLLEENYHMIKKSPSFLKMTTLILRAKFYFDKKVSKETREHLWAAASHGLFRRLLGLYVYLKQDDIPEVQSCKSAVKSWAQVELHPDYLKGFVTMEKLFEKFYFEFSAGAKIVAYQDFKKHSDIFFERLISSGYEEFKKINGGKVLTDNDGWITATHLINNKLDKLQLDFPSMSHYIKLPQFAQPGYDKRGPMNQEAV